MLLSEQTDGVVTGSLVVRDELADCVGRRGDRSWISLILDTTQLPLDGRLEDAIATAEVSDDRLDGYVCTARDRVQGQLSRWLVPEDPGRRIEDRASGPLGGLSAPDHSILPARTIHISKTNSNIPRAQES